MTKSKKGLFTAGSILSIISSAFIILLALLMLIGSSAVKEDVLVDVFKSDPAYSYVEEADGGYTISWVDDGILSTMDDETLRSVVKFFNVVLVVGGLVCLAFGVAKIIFAIKVLNASNRYKYKKGCVVTLLVMSIIGGAWLTSILFIIGMCMNDNSNNKKQIENKQDNNQAEDNKKEDVVIE